MSWKKTILTVETFVENRPDMSVHTETAIQSAINQAAGLLDSETNGLLGKVWDFNYLDPGFAPDSDLKRNEWELGQLVEAMIVQTQYMLNMGNDLSQGGGSYSIGNINSSWSKPLERDIIAPGVYKLLQNGRVFLLQSFTNAKNACCDNECDCFFDRYSQEPITRAIGDTRYVKVEQGKEQAGNVAIVGSNGLVSFANPNDLSFSNFNATRIKDWNKNDYVEIDKVTNQLFRGKDLYGVHSGVERGEIYNLIANAQMNWKPTFDYKAEQIWGFAFQDTDGNWYTQEYLVLKDNINKNPLENPDYWQPLGGRVDNIDIIANIVYDKLVKNFNNDFDNFKLEIQDIINAFKGEISYRLQDFIDETRNNFIPNEIQKQLNELPTIKNILFHKNTCYFFKTREEFNSEIGAKYNLILGEDYEELTPNEIIGIGENNELVGNNEVSYLLKQSDLPNLSYEMKLNGTGYRAYAVVNNPNNLISSVNNEPGQRYDGQKYEAYAHPSYTFTLNGGVEQTPIDLTINPQYRQYYGIRFLRDIIQKSLVKGGAYIGGEGISISDDVISIDTSIVATKNDITQLKSTVQDIDRNYLTVDNNNSLTKNGNIVDTLKIGDDDGNIFINSISPSITINGPYSNTYLKIKLDGDIINQQVGVFYPLRYMDDITSKIVDGNHIVNKKYVDNAINNIKPRISFFEGQSLMFKTKALADKFIAKYSLQLGVDYEITPSGRYIFTGTNGANDGDSYITKNHIKKFGLNKNSGISNFIVGGSLGNESSTFGKTGYREIDITDTNNVSIGVDSPSAYKPLYVERYEIVFLRDIVK